MQDPDVFGIGRRLHAERAADVMGKNAQTFGLDPEQVLGKRAAQAEHALAADVQGEAPALRLVGRECRARLHGRDDHAVAHDPHAGDVGGRCERPLRRLVVAKAPVEAEVACPSCRRGASAASAASGSTTAAMGSMSATISSAASCAACASSATTMASGSPT